MAPLALTAEPPVLSLLGTAYEQAIAHLLMTRIFPMDRSRKMTLSGREDSIHV
jgi:hypothetical protein